jgi:hypothetical protein
MSPSVTQEKTPTNEPLNPDEMSSDLENGDTIARKPSFENLDKDDPATMQARENLKHTTISDKEPLEENGGSDMTGIDPLKPRTKMTPEPPEPSEAQDAEMRECISSPKKKRGRELEDDEARELETTDSREEAAASPNDKLNGGRTTRLAPEKKRHRDISAETLAEAEGLREVRLGTNILNNLLNLINFFWFANHLFVG